MAAYGTTKLAREGFFLRGDIGRGEEVLAYFGLKGKGREGEVADLMDEVVRRWEAASPDAATRADELMRMATAKIEEMKAERESMLFKIADLEEAAREAAGDPGAYSGDLDEEE